MTSKPFFSIIIPTLNEEKYLPRLLKNLTHQTFKNFEVIIVDAKSQDKTIQKAKKFQSQLNLIIHTTDKKNVSHQRNLGAKHAQANILVFFDADTQIPSYYLGKIRQAFITKKPHVLTTWTKADSSLDKDKAIATGANLLFEVSKFINFPACYGAMIAIRKKVFEDIKGFDTSIKFGEDSQLLQKAIKRNYKYVILKQPRYIFSLRRFRKEGTLKALRKYAQLDLNILFNGYDDLPFEYPMGGHVFNPPQSTKPSLLWLQQTAKKIKTSLKPKKKRSKLRQFLDSLMEEAEIRR